MNRIKFLTFLTLSLWACSESPKDGLTTQKTEPNIESENSKYETINLLVNNPIVLDSSDWVLYPLTLEELEEQRWDLKVVATVDNTLIGIFHSTTVELKKQDFFLTA